MDVSIQTTAIANAVRQASDDLPDNPAELNLSPVLFSGYRELAKLRFDFPLILVEDDAEGAYVKSLSDIINGILREIAPAGMNGERLRRHVLRLEDEIRVLVSGGAGGKLSALWAVAERDMLSRVDESGRENLKGSLRLARGVLRCDGIVIECDGETAHKLVDRAWAMVEQDKARKFGSVISRLILKLSEILKADFMKSEDARNPERLRRSMGTAFEADFDFQEMSRVLSSAAPKNPLSETRLQRIRAILSILESQRFFPLPGKKFKRPRSFVFARCAQALKAFQDRLPEMAELVKAVSIAELEIENRYAESRHDRYFASFDETALGLEDLAAFPSYLVRLLTRRLGAAEQEHLFRILSSDLPIKILRQTDDILADVSDDSVRFSTGDANALVSGMAVGLNSAFVLQSGTAGLYRLRDRIMDGMAFNGPALINVYSGSNANVPGFPAYIISASATESRAFPIFVYNPAAGPDWASRFCVDDNPQPGAAWPVHRLGYEDDELQTISSDIAFTFVDFAACDDRMGKYLVRVPHADWTENMVPLGEYLAQDSETGCGKTPYILMADQFDRLHRIIVDDKLISAARQHGERWRSLQELGGIDNSHALKLLARERKVWEVEKQQAIDAAAPLKEPVDREPQEAAPSSPEVAPDIEAPPPVEEGPVEEPFIETARCTTCNECTDLNNRMFAYDENQQAYIADLDAGSFKDLVVAAESCQVCIIHPGKPRNPDEHGLDELIPRAEPFN